MGGPGSGALGGQMPPGGGPGGGPGGHHPHHHGGYHGGGPGGMHGGPGGKRDKGLQSGFGGNPYGQGGLGMYLK